MTSTPKRILSLERLVHEPARLAILTILAETEEADFKFLLAATGMTKGNLSSHAAKLEQAGYIEVMKRFHGKLPVTSFRLTAAGRRALQRYWRQIASVGLPAEVDREG